MKPENKVSFQRVIRATGYSLQGLKSAYRFEAAFRQEVWLSMVLIPLGLWLGNGALEKAMLVGVILMILIVELLNSAIESVVDRIGSEYHELSGRAKDIGSAAVFLSFLLAVVIWGLVIFG